MKSLIKFKSQPIKKRIWQAGAERSLWLFGAGMALLLSIAKPGLAQVVNGTVFEDTNGDNALTLGEPGLGQGITIRLLDGISRQELDITTTDISGQYSFLNVANGNYLVQVDVDTVPNGFIFGNTSNNITTTVNNNIVTINYPFDPVNISGRVFEDTNLDNIQNNGESGLSSISVFLFNDLNNDGNPDGAAIASTVTDFAGDYGFNVPNGNYLVQVDTNDPDLVGRPYGGVTGNPNDPLNLVRNADVNNNILFDLNYPFDPGTPPAICSPTDPNNQLSFLQNPQLISGTNLQVGALYRFGNVFPGIDALVQIAGFNGGATLASLDNNSTGEVAAFQPTLNPPNAAGTSSVDFDITFVNAGTTIPVALTFKAAGLDIDGSTGDGNPNGLREFIQLTNLSSFTLDPNTLLIATSIPPDATRFESSTTQFQPGVSLNAVEALVVTQYNDVSQFRYSIGAINNTNSGIQRLNSFFLACGSISPPSVDFGDAPDTYGTDATAGNSVNGTDPIGASHAIVSGIQLGANAPDLEADGQPSADATGDGADEDGITLLPLTAGSTGYSIPPENITATTNGTATLNAWIDFNKNGTFEPSEYASVAINNGTPAGSGLIWSNILVGSVGNTFARFRLTTDPSITASTPGGPAIDGEVEDYQVSIVAATSNQIINDTLSPRSCEVQGGSLSAENIFTPFDNGTFGFEDGSQNQSPATNPYTGITGGIYAQYIPRVNNNDFNPPNFGQYSFVANITRARNRFQLEPVSDPVYGVTGRFFATDPDINSIPALGVTLNGLIPNQFYEVSFWAANSEPNGAANQIDVFIDNQSVFSTGPLNPNPAGVPWTKYRFTFTNGPNTSIRIDLKSTEAGTGGLDFYLDNIELSLCSFQIDYGDAPSSYGDAIHTTIPPSPVLFIGNVPPDDESLTQLGGDAGIGADGDDTDGNDDEDAFITLPSIPTTGTYDLNNIPVNNISSQSAVLQGWIDFNQNGIFEAAEYQETIVNINQITANLSWPIPAGISEGQTFARFRLTSNPLSDDPTTVNIDERSQNAVIGGEVEDYQIAIASTAPDLLLVKRITAINGNSNITNNGQNLNAFNDDPNSTDDNNSNWPDRNIYLRGAFNTVGIKPGDEVEYTIYFLSNGSQTAFNARICDRLPDETTFVADGFGVDRGIAFFNTTTTPLPNPPTATNLTNNPGDDAGEFFIAGSSSIPPFCSQDTANSTANSGAVVVDAEDLPNATAAGTPSNSYGFVRFKVRIK